MRKTRRFGDTAGNSSSVDIGVNPAENYRCGIMHCKELSHKLSKGTVLALLTYQKYAPLRLLESPFTARLT